MTNYYSSGGRYMFKGRELSPHDKQMFDIFNGIGQSPRRNSGISGKLPRGGTGSLPGSGSGTGTPAPAPAPSGPAPWAWAFPQYSQTWAFTPPTPSPLTRPPAFNGGGTPAPLSLASLQKKYGG